MSGTRWFDPGFAAPFLRNGCVPTAWTALQDKGNRTVEFARGLAVLAQTTKTTRGYVERCEFLLDHKFSSYSTESRIFDWARISGLKIAQTYSPDITYEDGPARERYSSRYGDYITIRTTRRVGRPTVAQFLRTTGRRGRWFILTHRHAQASINGRPKGSVSMRDRVHYAVRVESL